MFTGPNIVKNGLVLWLDAANTKSYTSGSTTWGDLSGNNNSGSLTNGPTFSSANGGSIVFDGTNDLVNIPYNSSFNFSGNTSMTVCIFKKVISQSAIFPALATWGDQSTSIGGWQITDWKDPTFSGPYGSITFARHQIAASFITFVVYNYKSTEEALSQMYVCFSYDSIQGDRMYINGALVASNNLTGSITTTSNFDILLAKRQVPGAYLNANIYFVQIYNRALSASEVLQNYNATKARYGL